MSLRRQLAKLVRADASRGDIGLGSRPPALSIVVFAGLAFVALGEFSSIAGHLCLIWSFVSMGAGIVAALLVPVAMLFRAYAYAGRMLVVALGSAVTPVATSRLIFETPYWVKRQAQPAIEAVVHYAGDGPYPRNDPDLIIVHGEPALPEDVAAVVRATGCFYSGHAMSFHITCDGVALAHHTYDYKSDSWSTWD